MSSADFRGRTTKLAAERISEMTVTGKAQIQGQLSEIRRSVSQSLEGSTQAQLSEITMHRDAGTLLKYACQVKRRGVHLMSHVVESDSFGQVHRQIRLGGFYAFRMIGVRTRTTFFARQTVLREGGFQHISNELQRSNVGPKRFEWVCLGVL